MKKISKLIKIMIILLIICSLILIILKNINVIKSKFIKPKYEIMKPQDYEEKMKELNGPKYKKVEVLKKFKGELPIGTITKRITDIVCNKWPEILVTTNEFSESDIKEYYLKNKENILVNFRINEINSFIQLIDKLKNINCNIKDECKYIEFEEEETYILVKVIYENEQEIEIKLKGEYASNFSIEF